MPEQVLASERETPGACDLSWTSFHHREKVARSCREANDEIRRLEARVAELEARLALEGVPSRVKAALGIEAREREERISR